MSDTLHAALPWVESRPSSAPAHQRGSTTVAKIGGAGLLLLATVVTASLATWSSNDPSLMHLSTAKPQNLLGAPGAIASDLVMTSLGLASLLALLPVFYWSLQLLTQGAIPRFKLRAVVAPFAILSLAAFLASLPKVAAWPLPAGYGGLLGDIVQSALTSAAGLLVAERAGLAAALVALAAGAGGMIFALGLSRRDLTAMVQFAKRPFEPDHTWVSKLRHGDHAEPMPPLTPMPEMTLAPKAFTPPPLSLTPDLLPQWTTHHGPHSHGFVEAPPARIAPIPASTAVNPPVVAAPLPAAPAFAHPVELPAPAPAVVAPPKLVHRLPSTSLLPRTSRMRSSALEMSLAEKLRADRLRDVLAEFAVLGEVRDHLAGPVVTTFVFEPQAGTRSTRVLGMADEIARNLDVPSVRIQLAAGRSSLVLELPHDDAIAIGIRDLVEHKDFNASDMRLPLAIGATAQGEPVVADLASMPSLLLAGRDSESRAAMLRGLIASLAYRHTAETLTLAVADSTGALGALPALPHHCGHAPAVGVRQTMDLLTWAASEIDQRTLRLRALAQSRTIEQFNQRRAATPNAADIAPMPYLVVVVSDLAEAAIPAVAALEDAVYRIVRDGAAAGVFLIAATSRVDTQSLPDALKAAFPTRLALRLASRPESRAFLGETGAEDLLPQGDALGMTTREDVRRIFGGGAISRLHPVGVTLDQAQAIAAAAQPVLETEAVASTPLPKWQPQRVA